MSRANINRHISPSCRQVSQPSRTSRGQSTSVEELHPFWYHCTVALNIKDDDAERLVSELAAMTGESKTRAVRVALSERRERLLHSTNDTGLRHFLETELWPQIPPKMLGHAPSKAEREAILGFGKSGF
jgi:antitoxin VapB